MEENLVSLQTSEKNGWTLLRMKGRLDRISAPGVSGEADKVLAAASRLAVEMSELEYLSSAGIRVLMRLSKMSRAGGKDFALVAPKGFVKTVLTESRLDMFVTIYASAEELP
ncbi:MAG: STAS domain-containing protein [Schwartzia sp.]|nr:STAS domain-containing protein [Schwartzia sp. (in: firmicutes)]